MIVKHYFYDMKKFNKCIYPIALIEKDMKLEEIYVLFLAANYVMSTSTEIGEDSAK